MGLHLILHSDGRSAFTPINGSRVNLQGMQVYTSSGEWSVRDGLSVLAA